MRGVDGGVLVSEAEAADHVFRHEPRLPVDLHHAHVVALEGEGRLVLLQKSEAV
jgi:hypothetical protein